LAARLFGRSRRVRSSLRCWRACVAGHDGEDMRVFVAGATGAVGSRLIPLLVSAGHSVLGLTRTPGKAETIRRAGADVAVVDALDGVAVRQAVIGAKPDVIVHEMTALSGVSDLRRFDRVFALTNRLRTEGLDHLLAAAKQAGTRRMVVQSFGGWPFARTGGAVKTEKDPLDPDPPKQLRRTLDAIRYLESKTTGAFEGEGLVLRYGAFYGPATGMLDRSMIEQLRRRRVPLIGEANGWWSFLHIDDAAAATAIAIERGAPGIYNIVDDEPAAVREWLPALAALVGAKPPLRVPKWLARLIAGEHIVTMMTETRAGSNAKAKRELSWRPAHASWRQGFAEVLAQAV
jgi:2-alkyl-3-oxoalkanoate reductase